MGSGWAEGVEEKHSGEVNTARAQSGFENSVRNEKQVSACPSLPSHNLLSVSLLSQSCLTALVSPAAVLPHPWAGLAPTKQGPPSAPEGMGFPAEPPGASSWASHMLCGRAWSRCHTGEPLSSMEWTGPEAGLGRLQGRVLREMEGLPWVSGAPGSSPWCARNQRWGLSK